MVCNLQTPRHWLTCCLNLAKGYIVLYDSLQPDYQESDYEQRKAYFTPLARIVPQILKYIGYYDCRREFKPKWKQWNIYFPMKDENPYTQCDGKSCGSFALKYVEMILTKTYELPFDKEAVKAYRLHVAQSIFNFSTDDSTISS